MLYESIQKQLVPLADDVIVYPAHGPGSSCGKNLGPNTFSTIGEEKATNYAMKAATKESFIEQVTDGIAAPPPYFPINARINKEGYDPLDAVIEKGMTALSVTDFKSATKDETILLDTRPAATFTLGFVPGSISIGLEGRFAEWAGGLLPFDAPILLITEVGKEKESIIRLARVGFHRIDGHLQGGFEAWTKAGEETDMIIDVEADELMMDIPHDPNLLVLDVRRENEFAGAHLKDALNFPLGNMTDPGSMSTIEDTQNLYVHCAGGYRSVIACSLLKRQGFHQLRNVLGGWSAISKEEKAQIVKEAALAR
jgi:rhodanese-related sulfurtransferase